MDQNKILEYSRLYRRHQLRLSKGIMIFLVAVGLIIIGVGIFLCAYKYTPGKLVIGIIMIITGLLNIPLGFKFKTITTNNINKMSDKEAYTRYCKVYGITK